MLHYSPMESTLHNSAPLDLEGAGRGSVGRRSLAAMRFYVPTHIAAIFAVGLTFISASPVLWSEMLREEINTLRAHGMSEVNAPHESHFATAISPLKDNNRAR